MALTAEQELWNQACGLIGEYEITEGQTTDKQYVLCNRFYSIARDEILCMHKWNEATKRAMIVQDSAEPLFGFSYRFEIPSDNLRIVSINSDTKDWRIEDGYIYTNSGYNPEIWQEDENYVSGQYVSRNDITYLCNVSNTAATANDPETDTTTWTTTGDDYVVINLEYIYKLTDVASFSPKLKQCIVLNLAAKISVAITNTPKIRANLLEELETLVMPQARSLDAQQGKPAKLFNSSWIRSRY